MEKKRLYQLIGLSLLLICFVCVAQATHAVEGTVKTKTNKKQTKGKKIMQQLEITSPDKIHSVVFSRPIASMEPGIAYWQKIEIFQKEKGRLHVVEDPPHVVHGGAEAFSPDDNEAWSPDGRYLSIWEILDVDTNKTVIGFLDVCAGTWEGFKGKTIEGKTKSATTDNYSGWRKDKPHTMLLVGEPPKWRDYIEALPINESNPDECK